MGIIWLIIKIILWTLLVSICFIISICMLIVLAPMRYEAYLEKYEELNYEIKFKYLIGISGCFSLQDGIPSRKISFFGKQVYSFKEEEDQLDKQEVTPNPVATSTIENQCSECKVIKSSFTEEGKIIKKTEVVSSEVEEMINEQPISKLSKKGVKSLLREVAALPHYIAILKNVFKLIKELITYIGPREWSFELVIGREDPADTGELIAKLIMLYPWYYQHGVIEGNYEASGIWGGFLAEGKFCIAGILKRIIVFLWQRPTRELIKLILRQRKEDNDGR